MAKEKFKRGERFTWKSLLAKPTGEFLSRYFSSQGYKDGVHGLVLSSLQAFVELLIYVKLWELSRFPERALSASEVAAEMKNIQKEVNYWVADTLVKESGGLMNRIKRKFRLR